MKKILKFVGISIGILSIYFMLSINLQNISITNNYKCLMIMTNEDVPINKMLNVAQSNNLTFQIRNFVQYGFFNRTVKIEAINPTNKIKLGKQKSLLPNKNIYISKYKKENKRKTNIFFIEPNSKNDLDNIQHILSSNDISASYCNSDNFHLGYNLFFQSNIIFVIVLSLITVFATLMHYISRNKEIAVLKINGKSTFSISLSLYKKELLTTLKGILIIIIPFSIYILLKDASQLLYYFELVGIISSLTLLIYSIIALLGLPYINFLNVTTSVKNNRNNTVIYLILLLFKIVLTTTLFINIMNVFSSSKELYLTLNNSNSINKFSLYELNIRNYKPSTANKKLTTYISNFKTGIYRFEYCPEENIDKNYTIDVNDTEDLNFHSIKASSNLLPKLNIKDNNNNGITLSPSKNYLLIPQKYWADRNIIKKNYNSNTEYQCICIKDNQKITNFTDPSCYSYNMILSLTPLKSNFSISSDQKIFMTKEKAKLINREIDKLKIEHASIKASPLSDELNETTGTIKYSLLTNTIFLVILLVTVAVVNYVSILSYYEIKKKMLAIENLLGRSNLKEISTFLIINGIITLIISLGINPFFILLIIPESIVFLMILQAKSFKNTTLILKGE
ncbi:hypothetical protein SAMN04487761_11310 [Lachnospiraceae bacterium C7]|nr:hypothetical protein SAMN04487761_11310 [Lachnospiraceae bacterium C7]